MKRRRQNREIIRDLVAFAAPPAKGKGGWPDKIRRARKLALEAAEALAPWGRGGTDKRQTDLEDFLKSVKVDTAPPVSADAAP